MIKKKVISSPSSIKELFDQIKDIISKHKEMGDSSPLSSINIDQLESNVRKASALKNSDSDEFRKLIGWGVHRHEGNSLIKQLMIIKRVLVQRFRNNLKMMEGFGFKMC